MARKVKNKNIRMSAKLPNRYDVEDKIICLNCFNCGKPIDTIDEGYTDEEFEDYFTKVDGDRSSIVNYQNGDGSVRRINIDITMWDDAIVKTVSAGYGSTLDGDMYLIGICDDCMKNKIDSGNTILMGNYMGLGDSKETEKTIRNSRRLRNLNILTDDKK